MSEQAPLVSVIMNCFNSDKYLVEAVDSVVAQTYKHWELIFWDNQSTDSSAEILRSYQDERIKYFYAPEHTSLGEARNLALQKAKGVYVSFLDADDLYVEDRIEHLLTAFREDDDVGLVYSNGYVLSEKKKVKKPFYTVPQPEGDLFEHLIGSYNLMLPSVIFKLSIVNEHNLLFDKRFSMVEEFDFFLKLSRFCQISYIDKKLCCWRKHENSLSFSERDKWKVEYELMYRDITNDYPYLIESDSLVKLKLKILYYKFTDGIIFNDVVNRDLIKPYMAHSKKLLLVYILSFLGKRIFALVIHGFREFIK